MPFLTLQKGVIVFYGVKYQPQVLHQGHLTTEPSKPRTLMVLLETLIMIDEVFWVFWGFFLLSDGQKCVIFVFLSVVEEAKAAQILGSSSFIFRYFARVMVQWRCHQEGHVRELLQVCCCWFMKSAKAFMLVFPDMLRKGSDKTTARVTGPI